MQITNNVAANNAENKLNYLQTADSWMQKVQDMLGRMGEIAVMANDGTKSGTDTAEPDFRVPFFLCPEGE